MKGDAMRKKIALIVSLALVNTLIAPGCATLMEERTQKIPVTSSPLGAAISVNGQTKGLTPLEIALDRKVKDQVLRVESAGYNPLEIRVKRGVSAGKLIMDVVLGAAAGFAAGLLYAGITREPGITTHPRGFDSETVLVIAIPVLMIGIPLIDSASGKLYSLRPTELTVTLTKADGPARVDTVLVDADDFRNIKWIRVRKN
jgi:PEGA domain